MARAILRGLRRRGRLRASTRSHHHDHRQHLVHPPDAEHRSAAFRPRLRGEDRVRQTAGQLSADPLARRGPECDRRIPERLRKPRLGTGRAAAPGVRGRHDPLPQHRARHSTVEISTHAGRDQGVHRGLHPERRPGHPLHPDSAGLPGRPWSTRHPRGSYNMSSSGPRAASARRAVAALLRPRSVALVGASSDVEKFSGQPLRNLLAAGFTGAVYPVNPRGGEMHGVPVLSNAADIPHGTDLGVIMVPAAAAVDVVTILGDRGVTTAIVAVGGFAELGTEAGRELQGRLGETARRHGIRIVGPNTNGVYNATEGIPLGYNYVHSLRLRPGAIGLISHSGAMLGGFLSLLEQFGQGISAFVSCGNEIDLTMDDYCDYLVDDNATHVLALIMDAVSDGARFRRLAERARAVGKPIVVLKLGNSSAGTQATQAHSSRLAGSSAAYEAVFHAEGIVSVPTLETLALAVTLLAQRRRPRRAGVVATSSSGAGSIMVADVLTELGTPPVALAPATVEAMTPHAGFAQVINPFDNGAAGLANTEPSLLALADDPRAGSFVSYLHPMPTETWRTTLASAIADVARRHLDMPVVAISPASMTDDEARIYREAGVPVLGSTLDALTVIAALHRRLAAAANAEVVETDQTRTTTAEGHSLSEIDSKQVLRPFGIRFPIEILASTADDATTAATSLGLPVVQKATGANLTHKSEHALVQVGVGTPQEVRT